MILRTKENFVVVAGFLGISLFIQPKLVLFSNKLKFHASNYVSHAFRKNLIFVFVDSWSCILEAMFGEKPIYLCR